MVPHPLDADDLQVAAQFGVTGCRDRGVLRDGHVGVCQTHVVNDRDVRLGDRRKQVEGRQGEIGSRRLRKAIGLQAWLQIHGVAGASP